ncbi:MAG: PASTA domain-containing protein [Nannocystaceae bacterium]
MPFESANIIATGQLLNPDGSGRPEASIRLELLAAEPDTPVEIIAEALGEPDGSFQLNIGGGSPMHQASHVLLLRLVVDELLVAESWQSLSPAGDLVTIDFGILTVQEVPAYSVGPRSFYGIPEGMVVGAGSEGGPEGGAAEGVPQAEHDAALAQLASAQAELADAQTELSSAQTELADAQQQITTLQEQLSGSSSIGAVVENVGNQLKATQQSLRSSGAPIQLGKISMDLKVMPSGDGTSFSFVAPGQPGVEGAALSTLHLDFVDQSPVPEPPAAVTVPDLQGLTELAVRRVASSLGLGVKSLLQAVADDGPVEQAGRAIRQIPAAGAGVDPGTVITVLFGKALDA